MAYRLGAISYSRHWLRSDEAEANLFAFLLEQKDNAGGLVFPGLRIVHDFPVARGVPLRVIADGILPANDYMRGELVGRRVTEPRGITFSAMSLPRYVRESCHVKRSQIEMQLGVRGMDRLSQMMLYREFMLDWRHKPPASRSVMLASNRILLEQMMRGQTKLRQLVAEYFKLLWVTRDKSGRTNPGATLAQMHRPIRAMADQIKLDESRLTSIIRRMAWAQVLMTEITNLVTELVMDCDDPGVTLDELWRKVEHLQIKPFDYAVRMAYRMKLDIKPEPEIRSCLRQALIVELAMCWLDDMLSDYKHNPTTYAALPLLGQLQDSLPQMVFHPAYEDLAGRLSDYYQQLARSFANRERPQFTHIAQSMQDLIERRDLVGHYELLATPHICTKSATAAARG